MSTPLWPRGVEVRVCRVCSIIADARFCGECGTETEETKVFNKEGVAFEPVEGSRRDVRHGLTETEAEIMMLLAEGFTNGGIAARLNVTEQTVKYHLAMIYPRIEAKNRVQAVDWWRHIQKEAS